MKLEKFSVAVFDMDGTLLDSMHIWDNLIDAYLCEQNLQPWPELREEIRALDMRDTAAYLQAHGVQLGIEAIMDGINELAAREYDAKAAPKPGIKAYLEKLRAQGVALAAATATDRVVAEPVLARMGLLPYFAAVLTCTEEGVDKHTPEIYLRAARAAGGNPPRDCAVFEDALHCIQTVKAAGFYTVAVQDASAAYAWEEICRTADAHIASYEELLG